MVTLCRETVMLWQGNANAVVDLGAKDGYIISKLPS